MFIGHYAPVLALKAVRKSPSLAVGFLAVQLIDIGFFTLAYFGIEKWRLNPSLLGFMPVDLYFMPFTHSLIASMGWGIAAALVTMALTPVGRKLIDGLLIGLLVVSHWFLDLIVHRQDLPLLHDAETKFGLGLWDQPWTAAPLEMGLLLAAFFLFMKATRANDRAGKIAPWVLLSAMMAMQAVNWFTPPTSNPAIFSGLGLLGYFALAALAYWLDQVRSDPAPEFLATSTVVMTGLHQ